MEKKVKSESSGRFELERNNEASDRKAQKFADVRRRLVAAAVVSMRALPLGSRDFTGSYKGVRTALVSIRANHLTQT